MLNNTLGISLIGQNYHNYGQLIANNFLNMLEHQANDVAPMSPIAGQLWWDTGSKILKCYDGSKFKPCSSSTVADTGPTGPLVGDQWWDSTTDQLKVFDGTDWVIVGPNYIKDQGFTGMRSNSIVDTTGNLHVISTVEVNGETIGVVSKDSTFTPQATINGITQIAKGINLTPSASFVGNVSNALSLGGYAANVYVKTTDMVSTLNGSLVIQGLNGLSINNQNTFSTYANTSGVQLRSVDSNVTLSSGSVSLTLSSSNNTVTISSTPTVPASITSKYYVDTLVATTDANTRAYIDQTVMGISGESPIPTIRALSAAINDDPYYYINTRALIDLKANIANPTFTGIPRAATMPSTDDSTALATTSFVKVATSNITHLGIVDGITTSGLIQPTVNDQIDIGTIAKKFRSVYGTSMSAVYGDLAEKYRSDAVYLPGTVVVFGGRSEVTVSDQYCDTRIAGVISTKPGYIMNDRNLTDAAVALTGKVPCKVVGPVKKGDVLVNSHFAGVATKISNSDWKPGCVIGKSLEDSNETGIRDIMVSVGRF